MPFVDRIHPRSVPIGRQPRSARRASATISSAGRACSASSSERRVNRRWLVAAVGPPGHTARAVGVLVRQPAERVPELVRRDKRAQRVAAGRRREAAADPAVGIAVRDDQNLTRCGRRQRRVLHDDRMRLRRHGDTARVDIRAAAAEPQLQRRRPALANLRVAVDARLRGRDLHRVDVEVGPITAERLDAPEDVQVPIEWARNFACSDAR